MARVHTIGLDIAKDVFQIHAIDHAGKVCMRRRVRRTEVAQTFSEIPACLVGIEASSASHHWARTLSRLGHTVKLMPAQYVKPYVKVQKNDRNDAEAICEAVRRPTMRFVPVKTKKQQSVLFLHTARESFLRQKVALSNALRGFFAEFGVVQPAGKAGLRDIVEFARTLTTRLVPKNALIIMQMLADQLDTLKRRILKCEGLIEASNKLDERCKRLEEVPGIGPIVASAIVGYMGDPKRFRSGRQFAAWIGLVPKEISSGGKSRMKHITRAGNTYLRRLLYLGATAAIRFGKGPKSATALQRWADSIRQRKPYRVAVIAVANKIARIARAILAKREPFFALPAKS